LPGTAVIGILSVLRENTARIFENVDAKPKIELFRLSVATPSFLLGPIDAIKRVVLPDL